jgi:hypothetical protein
MNVNRRESLALMAAFCGATLVGARRMLGATVDGQTTGADRLLSGADLILLNEVGETILPATPGSAGAKAANVAAYMADRVANFYGEAERMIFTAGLVQLQTGSRARFAGREFLALSANERHDLILGLDRQRPQPDYYRMIKRLAVDGYFTSEIGATEAMAHVAVPGRFEGVVVIPPGTKAWSD